MVVVIQESCNNKDSNSNGTATTSSTSTTRKYIKPNFFINDHRDILVEVLKRLDGKSLGKASCVCRLWSSIARSDDAVWEHVCFRHVPPPGSRHVVLALGGYESLFRVCVGPVLNRVDGFGLTRRVWTKQGAQLLLSLFCVDYYEKLDKTSGSRVGCDAGPSSLMFLCNPVNV